MARRCPEAAGDLSEPGPGEERNLPSRQMSDFAGGKGSAVKSHSMGGCGSGLLRHAGPARGRSRRYLEAVLGELGWQLGSQEEFGGAGVGGVAAVIMTLGRSPSNTQ